MVFYFKRDKWSLRKKFQNGRYTYRIQCEGNNNAAVTPRESPNIQIENTYKKTIIT